MPENYDLHCHSTASDGALSPTELVRRAYEFGVSSLALTDHDTVAGINEAQAAAKATGIKLIPGIELSASWQNKCVHIVGLDVNPEHPQLHDAIANLRAMRTERAEKIAAKLDKVHIPDSLEAVKKTVGEGMITRSHFADFLLSQCYVNTHQEAFDRYLGGGKIAYVSTSWTQMELVINWIAQSGGIAVLAHPLRYNLSASWIKRLLVAFKDAGGLGLEVVTGRSDPNEISLLANYAAQFELAGSVGSDFHNPKIQWVELGRLSPLPQKIKPVWELFGGVDEKCTL